MTEEQKAAIKDELMKASARFNELNWQMQDEIETMANLTKGTTVDEQRVLAELDKILNIEREVKRTQLTLSIRIKNKLTAEQQLSFNSYCRSPTCPDSTNRKWRRSRAALEFESRLAQRGLSPLRSRRFNELQFEARPDPNACLIN